MKILIGAVLLFGSIYLIVNNNILLLLFIISLIALVAIHEAGHAYFMRKHGVEIKEFGIGIGPTGKQLFYIGARKIRLPFLSLELPPIAFHPFLIGAYVLPTEAGEKHLANLPLKARLQIFGGGVYANLLLAVIIFFLIQTWLVILLLQHNLMLTSNLLLMTILSFILVMSLVKWRYAFSILSPIVMGALTIGFLWFIFFVPKVAESLVGQSGATESLVGPIGIISMGVNATANTNPLAVIELVVLIFAITLSLGLTNSLPVPPLDGGHIIKAIMERFRVPSKVITVYGWAGFGLFVTFIIFVIGNDIYHFFIR